MLRPQAAVSIIVDEDTTGKKKIQYIVTGRSNSEFKKWSTTGRLLKGLTDISRGYLTIFTMLSRVFLQQFPFERQPKERSRQRQRGVAIKKNKVPAPQAPMDPHDF
jgi:hypothetical protein